jgi:hypothetical protein
MCRISRIAEDVSSRPTRYRLIGYALMQGGRRFRVYVDAAVPITTQAMVFTQAAPVYFDQDEQSLGVRPAPRGLTESVRARLLGQPVDNDFRVGIFQPLG